MVTVMTFEEGQGMMGGEPRIGSHDIMTQCPILTMVYPAIGQVVLKDCR
jgi:hypothetical protein